MTSVHGRDGGLQQVLDWVKSQPSWQAKCCEMLLEKEHLEPDDIEELLATAKASHGADEDASPPPIASSVVPSISGDTTKVAITAIRNVRNANAIDSRDGLAFAETGLTLVYGRNGAGKSGYVRILKRSCRARSGSSRVHPNIYTSPTSTVPARADIEFTSDGIARVEAWTDDEPCDPLLSRISVFDSDCATVQVAADNEIAFQPLSLALLDRLADVARLLRRELTRERDQLRANMQASVIMRGLRRSSEVGMLLSELSAKTNVADVKDLAEWGEDEKRRLAQLQVDLADSPTRRASQVRAQLSRLESTHRLMRSIERVLGDAACEDLLRKQENLLSRQEALRVAANKAFGEEPLEGVGSDAWQSLWAAARRFSRLDAYPGEAFPVTRADSRCVLCLQNLGDSAQGRLIRFAEFVESDVQRQVDIVAAEVRAQQEEIAALELPSSRTLVPDLEDASSQTTQGLRRYVACARKRRLSLLRGGRSRDLVDLPHPPRDAVTQQVESLRARLRELSDAADSGDAGRLTRELEELEDRRILHQNKERILEDITRLSKIASLEAAIDDTDTAPITRLSSAVAKEVVTPALRDAFEEELQSLRLSTARIELVNVGGSYGAQRFRVKLIASPDTPPGEVLSEGEHTGVALAGFFAELSGSGSSGIVLDDPVSSLDHQWRRSVAERLVRAAAERQVIVFTHDAVFLLQITAVASREGVPTRTLHLMRHGRAAGVPQTGPPWIAMKVKRRLAYLRDRLQDAEAVFNRGEVSQYEALAREIYGLLRATWERAVEELLLNRVVERFGLEIQTRRLGPVVDLSTADIERVDAGMSKCSRFLTGHDAAPAIGEDVPGPEEVRKDIEALDNFVAELRKRDRS